MSFLGSGWRDRLLSLPENIAEGVKNFSSSVPSSAVLGVAASSATPTSPQYKPDRCNLDAGSELLEYYQNQWELLHLSNERNSSAASKCDVTITRLAADYNKQVAEVATLQMLVAQIPKVNEQIEQIMGTLGQLESLFSDVEVALLGLEDTIDARELQERQLDQRFQVAMYKERRNAEYEDLAVRLRNDYNKKKQESELKELLRQREHQASFQKQFEDDMAKYSKRGSVATLPGQKEFLDVPLAHDPDASLVSVDLNETENRLALPLQSNLPENNGSGLEAFLNEDLLYDASPLPRDPVDISLETQEEERCDSVDSVAPIVSSVPVTLTSEEEEEPPKEPSTILAPSESMYYTPDNTLEKLSDVGKKGE